MNVPPSSSLASPPPAAPGRRFQFGLRTALLLLLLVGLICGWYVDHRTAHLQIKHAHLRLEMQERQIAMLQEQVQQRSFGAVTMYWWKDADEFVEMLKQNENEDTFTEMAASLAKTCDFAALMQRMPDLLNDTNARTRERAVNLLRFCHGSRPDAVRAFVPEVVTLLTKSLDDPEHRVQGCAIYALQLIGPEASPALPRLQELFADDEFWFNSSAAAAISKIDPGQDVTTRLIELIRQRKRNWPSTASILAEHGEPTRARRFLTELYAELETDSDRQQIASYLNRIPDDAPVEAPVE